MSELLNEVRPGSATRAPLPPAEPLAGETVPDLIPDHYPGPVESLLAEEIPERAFARQRRPKLPPPEIKPKAKSTPAPVAVATEEPKPPKINPLTLYFHVPPGSLESRSEAFIEWVTETSGSSDSFIVDAYGAAIAKPPGVDDVFLASVSNLADALGRGKDHLSRPDQSALHLELDDGRVLCLVQAKWEVATVALGMIREQPLDRDLAIRYRQELGKLVRPVRRRARD